MPVHELDEVQRWMQAVITHPEGVVPGIAAPEAQNQIPLAAEDVEMVITRSRQLTSIERLQIYANAYYARLIECLQEEFPALRHAVGDDAFDAFAYAYLQRYPSKSYTLGELGARFPRFLKETRPTADAESAREEQWLDFLIELARLELLYSEVFDGPGVEGKELLRADRLKGISPDQWPNARLAAVPCLHLARFRFPVHEYISAVRNKSAPQFPELVDTYLAITRRDYVVRRIPLSRPQYLLLCALVRGRSVGDAIAKLVRMSPANDEGLAESLHHWFADWTAAGFFQAVDLPE